MSSKQPITQAICVRRLKVLADQTRLSVVQILMNGPKHVGELSALLDLDQSLLSHHLKVLRDADLVRSVRDGKAVLYSLAPSVKQAYDEYSLDLGCCSLSFNRK
ncbi:MAG: winged helix-turn-helix transcriptional regulator [Cyanothece sp. SIO1E1]|nr:winged helix-turn-helix transcriptional regulator [Cyanothece sp. SIO1E1]